MNGEKLIINFTPTGMIPTKDLTPYAPISPTEIIEDVLKASEVGISMVHLHARNTETEKPVYQKEVYGEIISGIRKYASELVICTSLSGRDFKEFDKRANPLLLGGDQKPDMGSLTLSSLNFPKQASINSPDMVKQLARKMLKCGIKPELEVFDLGMVNYAKYLIKTGVLKPPFYFNIILGNVSSAQANLLHAGMIINDLPENSLWSLGGIGQFQSEITAVSIASGGGVRIGLEDNIWYDKNKTKLATNIDLIKRVHELSKIAERKIMTPKELREKLELKKGNGEYGCK